MFKFSDAVIQLAPWSVSKAKNVIECPFNFYHSYRVKRRGVKPRRAEGNVGSAVHLALETTLKGVSLKEAMRRAVLDINLTTNEMHDAMSFIHNIEQFLQRLDEFKKGKNVTDTYVEHRFSILADGSPCAYGDPNVFFRGSWDLGLRVPTGKGGDFIVILDHKTGEPRTMDYYEDQLRAYAVSAMAAEPSIVGVQTAVHHVLAEEVIWNTPWSATRIQNEFFPWYVQFLEKAAAKAQTTDAMTGWQCNYCKHTDICPLQKK